MNATPHAPVRVGLLGVGTVGTAFADLLRSRSDLLLAKALVRDPTKPRRIVRPESVLTTDLDEVLERSDLIVELMGGTDDAVDAMLAALARGKAVVTANKAALAERWDDLLPAVQEGRLHFEASVMAGAPVIGAVAGSLRGNAPIEMHAVLNGTCGYVLARLEQGVGYDAAVAEAQRLGYAEADPTLDVSGLDAAHKLAVIARLTVDPGMPWERVASATRGIERLTPGIVQEAMEDGGRVQLVGSIVPVDGRWRTTVRPVYLPAGHPLTTGDETRAAMIYRGIGGEVFLAGPGAGGIETAAAVLGDVLAAAAGRPGPAPATAAAPVPATAQIEDLGELDPVGSDRSSASTPA
ncbi:MAG: homoserine dehydrogenase [Trueperaceae bacterium]